MDWENKFDEIQQSALKELANVGISHVATAIGEIAREKVEVSVPEFGVFSKQRLLEMEAANDGLVGAYLTVQGISNHTESLILLPRDAAFGLMDRFINVDPTISVETAALNQDEQDSVFCEISTVIAATYFSAVESMFGLKTEHGVPLVSFAGQTLASFVEKILQHQEGIYIATTFTSQRTNLHGKFMLIPDPHTVDLFFRAIGLMA